jgi:hypothetical protein
LFFLQFHDTVTTADETAADKEVIPELPIGATAAFTTAICKLVNYESNVTIYTDELESMFESAIVEPNTVPKLLWSESKVAVLRKVLKRLETFIEVQFFDTEKKIKGAKETRDELRLCLKIIDEFREEMAKPESERTKKKAAKKPAVGVGGVFGVAQSSASSSTLPFLDDEIQEIPVSATNPARPASAASSSSSSSGSSSSGSSSSSESEDEDVLLKIEKNDAKRLSVDAACMQIVKITFNYDEDKFEKFLTSSNKPEEHLRKVSIV